MKYEELTPVAMYCLNCGQKVIGYRNEDGGVRLECPRCKSVMYSKIKNQKKEVSVKIVLPKQETNY